MRKIFEYKLVRGKSDETETMYHSFNELGLQGWELVCFVPSIGAAGFHGFYYFKREINADWDTQLR